MDVRTLMRQAVQFNAHRPCVITETCELTFAEMWERGCRLANGLLALGLQSGDRVASLEANDLGGADIYVGAAIGNVVRVPLYPRNSREAHLDMLEHTQCRVLFVDPAFAAEVKGLEDELEDLEHVIVRDDTYEPWLEAQASTDPDVAIESSD